MAPAKIDPVKLNGPWTGGWALERQHTISAEFLGYGPSGNPRFDTKRSELGELVYRLKNRGDRSAVEAIADTAVDFIRSRRANLDVIVPVPPSRHRPFQPVVAIAHAIGQRLGKPVSTGVLKKVKPTAELKNVFEYAERRALLQGAFQANSAQARDRRILLIDDLYRSGASAAVVAETLLAAGAKTVLFLAMTKTRTRL